MTSTHDCGDVLTAVPDEDIRAATDFGLQFRVMFKALARGPWMLHSDRILDLREAFLATDALKELRQVGILTADGFIYWSSHSPMTFNSSVIFDSVPAQAV